MKSSVFTAFIILISFQIVVAQKYIKYIFLDNKVKIVIPVKLEKKDPVEFQNKEVLKIIRVWQNKTMDATLVAFEATAQQGNELYQMTESTFGQLSFMTTDKTVRSHKTQFINNRQEVCVIEISSNDNNNPDKAYEVIFSSKVNENTIIIFYFQCPLKKKKQWQPIINGIIKNLTIQL